jgi:hypothetical protein
VTSSRPASTRPTIKATTSYLHHSRGLPPVAVADSAIEGVAPKRDFRTPARRYKKVWTTGELLDVLDATGFTALHAVTVREPATAKTWLSVWATGARETG